MREEYDVVEDVRIKKGNFLFIRAFLRTLVAVLIFVIFCGLCFNAVYIYMAQNIEKAEKNSNLEQRDGSRKSYFIEQKLIKDLQRKTDEDTNK